MIFNYKKVGIIIIVSMILSSCAGKDEVVKTSAYGTDAYKVKCTNTPESCLEDAYKQCNGRTFTTIYSDSHAGGILADYIPGPTTWYALTFKCGGPGTKPNFAWRGTTTQEAISSMKAMQTIQKSFQPQTTQTNCYKLGNSINCTSR